MFETLTLLINPLMDFFKASHAIRWYSLLVLSVICDWSARNRAGGMYVPPLLMVKSFSYSAFAAACFSSSVLLETSMFASCIRSFVAEVLTKEDGRKAGVEIWTRQDKKRVAISGSLAPSFLSGARYLPTFNAQVVYSNYLMLQRMIVIICVYEFWISRLLD